MHIFYSSNVIVKATEVAITAQSCLFFICGVVIIRLAQCYYSDYKLLLNHSHELKISALVIYENKSRDK